MRRLRFAVLSVTIAAALTPTGGEPAVAATTPSPWVTSPSGTVGGEFTITATSTAPQVKLRLKDETYHQVHYEDTVDVVDGVATSAVVDTIGLPEGPYLIMAYDCTVDGCEPSANGRRFTVANERPVLTAPSEGVVVGGASFTASATAPEGTPSVAFLIDGAFVVADDAAPYSASLPTAGLGEGAHQLTAVICRVGVHYPCAGRSAPVGFTIPALHPVITALSRSAISPNGDGRADSTLVSYTLPEPQTASLTVVNSAGAVVFGPRPLHVAETAGSFTHRWYGKYNNGSFAIHGLHTIRIDTTHQLSDGVITGRAEQSVRVDLVAPRLSSITGSGVRFYPVADGYKDSFSSRVTVNESISRARLIIRNSAGTTVRTLARGPRSKGRFGLKWDGRTGSGRLAPAGTYTFQWVVTDLAANARRSGRSPVHLSHRKLEVRTAIETATASSIMGEKFAGACSQVRADVGGWVQSLGYYSLNRCSSSANDGDVATTLGVGSLPRAVRYGRIRISAYGKALKSGSHAVMYVNDTSGKAATSCLLDSAVNSYRCPSVAISRTGRTFTWRVFVSGGNWYAVKSFTLRWTYYVLA